MSHIVYTGISVTHKHTHTKAYMASFIYLFMFLIIRVNSASHTVSRPITFAKVYLIFVLPDSVIYG